VALTKKQALRKLIDSVDVVYLDPFGRPLLVDTQVLTMNRQPEEWPEFRRMFLACKLKGNELIDVFHVISQYKRKVVTMEGTTDEPKIILPSQ
jgi:hypothetical protein